MIRQTQMGVILEIKVKPHSNKTGFEKGALKVQSPPAEGKANREILSFLKKFFDREVELVGGFKGRNKVFLVKNITLEEARKKLSAFL